MDSMELTCRYKTFVVFYLIPVFKDYLFICGINFRYFIACGYSNSTLFGFHEIIDAQVEFTWLIEYTIK